MALTSQIWKLDKYYNLELPDDIESKRSRKRKRADKLREQASPPELSMREALKEFQSIGVYFGHSVAISGYILDFYCADLQLCIEVDGKFHLRRKTYDQKRDRRLYKRGIRTLRFTAAQVKHDSPAAIETIRKYIGTVRALRQLPPQLS